MTPARVELIYGTGPHVLTLTVRPLDSEGVAEGVFDLTTATAVVVDVGSAPAADPTIVVPLLTLVGTVNLDPTTGIFTISVTAANLATLGFGAFYAQPRVTFPASEIKTAPFHLVVIPGVVNA